MKQITLTVSIEGSDFNVQLSVDTDTDITELIVLLATAGASCRDIAMRRAMRAGESGDQVLDAYDRIYEQTVLETQG